MSIGSAIIGTVGGLVTANKAQKENKRNFQEQVRLQDETRQFSREQYDGLKSEANPYLDMGRRSLDNLNDPNAFKTSPGYDFRLNQGMEGLLGKKALSGLLRSGGTLAAATEYGQNAASDEYARYVNQQQQNAGFGTQGLNALAGAVKGSVDAQRLYDQDRGSAFNTRAKENVNNTRAGFNAVSTGINNVNAALGNMINPAKLGGL